MKHLILLHGALGSAEQFSTLREKLEDDFIVHAFNLTAHGGNVIPKEALSITLYANDVLSYMEENDLSKVSIFGYSMGGYVGMYLAKHYPGKVNKLVTLASKFYWDGSIAANEVKMLDATTIETKVPAFAAQLAKRHLDWKLLLKKTAEMMINLGSKNTLDAEDYKSIETKCLVMLGDRDKMVSLTETVTVYKSLPNAQLCVLPDTQHPLEQVDAMLVCSLIKKFI